MFIYLSLRVVPHPNLPPVGEGANNIEIQERVLFFSCSPLTHFSKLITFVKKNFPLPQGARGKMPTSHKGQGCHVVVGCVVTHRLNILPPQWGRLGGGYPFGFIPQLIKENLNCNNFSFSTFRFQLISPHPALPIQGGDLAGGKLC